MTLEEYMAKKHMPDIEMAKIVGRDQSVVGKYRRGKQQPPFDVIAKIHEATKGAVTFKDWLP